MRDILQAFGQQLMQKVRDKAIEATLKQLENMANFPASPVSPSLERVSSLDRTAINSLIRHQTDQAISEFLGLFEDNDSFRIVVRCENGEEVNAVKHGDDLSAALFGRRGWIVKYSKYPPTE